jgi:hypothetical protein
MPINVVNGKMDTLIPSVAEFDKDIVSDLLTSPLNPFIPQEETCHAWRPNHLQTFDAPLLRVWDCNSGSQPNENDGNRMLSRAPRQRLDSAQSRKTSLTKHLNHRNWEQPTPYISFTISPTALADLANSRSRKIWRKHQTLIVIDPNVRIAKGLPVLDVIAEMAHYGIEDPYRRSNQYYVNHYVCLWEVTAEEVVGQWQWDVLVENERWYEDIIMPAYRQHRRQFEFKPAENAVFDMSSMMKELDSKSLPPLNGELQ